MLYPSSSIVTLAGLIFAMSSCLAQQVVQVNLRVEGATTTIFEGLVSTNPHTVFTAMGGTHSCGGTNNTKNLAPGPTMTSALDNATFIAPGFAWDGPFNSSLRDYDITAIGGDVQTENESWNLLRNYQLVTTGGCQERLVGNFNNVLFAFGAIGPETVFLNLTGPTMVSRDQQVNFTVWNGNTNNTVAGAFIPDFGNVSGDDGVITVFFKSTGTFSLKAQRSDSIRSNSLQVGVFDEPPSTSTGVLSSTTVLPTTTVFPTTTVHSSVSPSSSV